MTVWYVDLCSCFSVWFGFCPVGDRETVLWGRSMQQRRPSYAPCSVIKAPNQNLQEQHSENPARMRSVKPCAGPQSQDCQQLVQLCEDIGFRTRWSQAGTLSHTSSWCNRSTYMLCIYIGMQVYMHIPDIHLRLHRQAGRQADTQTD